VSEFMENKLECFASHRVTTPTTLDNVDPIPQDQPVERSMWR
jgi:hypothetical protein